MEDSEVMRQKKIHYIYNKEMECMDPEERRKLQGERLRKTVELEYANVPERSSSYSKNKASTFSLANT